MKDHTGREWTIEEVPVFDGKGGLYAMRSNGSEARAFIRGDSLGISRTIAPPEIVASLVDPSAIRILHTGGDVDYQDKPDFSGYSDTFPNLKHLDMAMKHIRRIQGLDGLHGVTHLDLSGNDIERIEGLGGLRSLEVLHLNANDITSTAGLADLPCPEKLRELWLQENRIDRLEGFERLSGLQTLLAFHNQIESMAPLAACISLEEIQLYRNRIERIEGLGGMASLHVLDLQDNRITSLRGLGEVVAAVGEDGTFSRIGITGNPIDADELRAVWFSDERTEHVERTGKAWPWFNGFPILDEAIADARTTLDIDATCEEREEMGACRATHEKQREIANGRKWVPARGFDCERCEMDELFWKEAAFRSFARILRNPENCDEPDIDPEPLVSFYRERLWDNPNPLL